jgi:glycosyltransferase involved in cell wall biosynthesis
MNSLRILLVMIEPPLPFGNAAARWYYVLLKGLVQRGHRVTAFAACSSAAEAEAARELFPAPEYDLRCYTFPERNGLSAKWETFRHPFSYVFSPELRADLKRELADGCDVLHLEMHWSGWLGLKETKRALLNVHYLYAVDWQAGAELSFIERRQRQRALNAERLLLRKYPQIRTLSPRLTELVQQHAPKSLVTTVALGIDTSLYDFKPGGRETAVPTIGLVGSFSWGPTRSAALRLLDRLWPEIKQRVPAARLLIVGRDARSSLKEYCALPDVEIKENVPDIVPHMRRMNVLLYAPGPGSGMKVKVLEAMALGLPVVTNTDGVEGLNAVDGVHAGIAEDDAGLIDRTVRLLNDSVRPRLQSVAARELVKTECDPGTTLDGIETLYAHIIDGK